MGYARKLYVRDTKNSQMAVLEVTIDGDYHYLVLVNSSNVAPILIKKMVNTGEIELSLEFAEKIPIVFTTYSF